MTPRRDDDALSWDGDDDPTLDVGAGAADDATAEPATPAEPASSAGLPDGFTAVGRGKDTVGHLEADGTVTMPAEREPMGNAALIAIGVLGGVYVLLAVGWLIGGLRLQGVAGFLVAPDGQAPPLWTTGNLVAVVLATLAPLLWFATVYLLTRSGRAWLRWTLLAVGMVLLLPWPFVMVGAVGS